MRSCNPWFWHIGLTLWNDGYESAIADIMHLVLGWARKPHRNPDFEGRLEQPDSVSANVQLSIGQGTLQVSPLQVAMFVAAVGGTLYKPTVVEKIVPRTAPTRFMNLNRGQRPTGDPENLKAIQEAMVMVVATRAEPQPISSAGSASILLGRLAPLKTRPRDSHAWFAG